MRISRRGALVAAACVPAGFLMGVVANTVGAVVAGAAPGLRPAAGATSASRCAACGASDHAMLDPRCPAARKVR